LQSLQILYTFVLRAKIATIFGPNIDFCPHLYNLYSIQILRTLQGSIFRILQHFATKLCNFTNFSMLFLAACGDLFASPCLVLKLVYNWNCLLKGLKCTLKIIIQKVELCL
jgi:hypothetical protein